MLLAYGLSCLNLQYSSHPKIHEPGQWAPNEAGRIFLEPPFYPPTEPKNIWTMSQRAGSVTYLLFGAGFSLATYAVFVVLSDRLKWSWSVLGTLGGNALVAYILWGCWRIPFTNTPRKTLPFGLPFRPGSWRFPCVGPFCEASKNREFGYGCDPPSLGKANVVVV